MMRQLYSLLKYFAIFLNSVYILWLLYNGIDEGFKGNAVTVIAPLGMIFLLILNIILLYNKKTK
jgi:hypothetical protein